MRWRYGMRLGRGLSVSGGGAILVIHMFFWVIELTVVAIIKMSAYFAYLCSRGAQYYVTKEKAQTQRQTDAALASRIIDQRIKHVEYLPSGQTDPPSLWGLYLVQPSLGKPYAKYGRHPGTLKKLWLENRQGTVHELLLLSDKPLAQAATELLTKGVVSVKADAVSIVCGFAPNGAPILRSGQKQASEAIAQNSLYKGGGINEHAQL